MIESLRLALFVALAIVAFACGHSTTIGAVDSGMSPNAVPDASTADAGEPDPGGDAGVPDGGCAVVCGPTCCNTGEVCFQEQCCAPSCSGRRCGDDGCGGSCGECSGTEECRDGQCACRSLTDSEMCQASGRACGTLTEPDRCTQQSRTVDCGTCANGQRCNATFQCETCPSESGSQICARLGATCGAVTETDACGTERTAQCGACATGERCNAAHACELCPLESDADFCTRLGADCGSITAPDSCDVSRTVDCGRCAPGLQCNAATRACETCPPETDAAFCQRNLATCGTLSGLDGCRLPRTAECGNCTFPDTCDAHQCVPCVPATGPALCQTAGLQCGPLLATDNCGASRTVAECGPCAPTDRCDAAGQCHLCIGETDAQLCADNGVACGSGTFTDGCGLTRTIAECGPCVSGKACARTHQCVSSRFSLNDTCLGAEPLNFDLTGLASAKADLAQANNDTTTTCMASGNDVVYSFTLATPKNLTLQAASPSGNAWPVISLRTSCAQLTSEIACAGAAALAGNVLMEFVQLPAGTYYVWVDALNSGNGSVSLTAALSDPGLAPANDTCAGAIPLTFTNGAAHASGDNAIAVDDFSGLCFAMNGPDLVYRFELTVASDVLVRARRDPAATAFTPAVYVRSDCGSSAYANERGCANSTSAVGVATVAMPNLAPGTYSVVVDSTNGTVGPFTLEVVATPPIANDRCSGAIALNFVGPAATVTGDTLFATNDSVGTCGAMIGGDLVYTFSLAADSSVSARVTKGTGATAAFNPTVYIRGACASPLPADEVACGAYDYYVSAAVAAVPRLAAGTWYVIVDTTGYDTGPFTLEVSASPVPTNETCASAIAVPIDAATGIGTVLGDTTGTINDVPLTSCATSPGGDLVYTFKIPTGYTKNVVVSLTPPPSSPLRPVLAVRSDCAQRTSELGCLYSDTNGANLDLQLWQVPAGTYYVWVDSRQNFTNGSFALTVTLTDPPSAPTNDTCSNPTPLWFNPSTGHARASGSTANATDDFAGSCATVSAPHNGGDVVYTFTLEDQRAVTITLYKGSDTPAYKQIVYLRSDCTTTATENGCYWETTTGAGAILRKTLNAGTYYVIVDGMNATYGSFTLDVAAYDLPTNDDCPGVRTLTLDLNGFASAFADNCNGTANNTTCKSGVGIGQDLVYSYTLTSEKNVTIELDPGQTGYNVLHVRATCADKNTELSCSRQNGAGLNRVGFRNQRAGTYYVWVDADSAKCGVFSLSVSAVDPAPTARNDTCSGAESIVIDSITGIGATSGSTENGRSGGDGSCGAGSDADLVYAFTLTQPQAVEIRVTPAIGSPLIPVVYARRECTVPMTEMACAKVIAPATQAKLTFTRLTAGTYWFIVDSASALTAGAFDVQVTLTSPATSTVGNDACAAATPLTFNTTTNVASITGATTVGAIDDYYGLCSQGTALNGGDVAYAFTLSTAANVQAKVTRTGATSFLPAVYIRSDCADLMTEVGCTVHTSGVATLAAGLLPAGTYYVIVDGLAASTGVGTSGTFNLDVTAAPALANEDCAGAQPLQLDLTGHATASSDTTFATSTSDGTCSGAAVGAPDLVYSIALPTPRALSVQVTTSATTLRPIVYARRTCGDPQTTVACAAATATASPATLNLPVLAAGPWYLFVDGYAATSKGAFTITVTATDPAATPLNDTCAGAAPLTFDTATDKATVTADTSSAMDDYAGTCSGLAPDLVYWFTTTADQKVTAKVTGPAGSQPAVYLRNTCAQSSPSAEVTCATANAAIATAVVNRLPAGTWYVFVDGAVYAAGSATLEVSLEAPAPGPTNEACASVEALAFNGGTTTQATGTTLLGQDEAQGSCAMAGAPDTVYSFTTAAAQSITATVTPLATSPLFRPAVVLRPTCGDLWRTEAGCTVASAAGGAATLTVRNAPAGTWYLWVDGGGTTVTSGDFTLALALDAPTGPANDSCAGAAAMTRGQTVAGDTSTADDFYGGSGTVGGWFGGDCRVARAVASGPELVYSYTPATSGPFMVTLVPSGYNAVLYVTTICGATASSCVAFSDVTGNNPERVVVQGVAGTTYYLYADGASGQAGAFTLTVQ